VLILPLFSLSWKFEYFGEKVKGRLAKSTLIDEEPIQNGRFPGETAVSFYQLTTFVML
jgi:hypothetical protein